MNSLLYPLFLYLFVNNEDFTPLLSLLPLRAADSLQLAAAIVWADKKPKGHHFVCCDNRLREAAKKEGFSVLPKTL
jgi:hypothetical protein